MAPMTSELFGINVLLRGVGCLASSSMGDGVITGDSSEDSLTWFRDSLTGDSPCGDSAPSHSRAQNEVVTILKYTK